MKHIKRLLVLLLLLAAALRAAPAQAEGGLVFQPYWTFTTEAPVIGVQAGDINGDGVPEVVVLTSDGIVYVLENDGDLAWRYETAMAVVGLRVDDMDGDGHTAEIMVHGAGVIVLSDSERPLWTRALDSRWALLRELTIDLNGDGAPEVISVEIGGAGAPEEIPVCCGDSVWLYDAASGVCLPVSSRKFRQSVVDVWTGDINGDGHLEIVPSVACGHDVYVLDTSLDQVWTKVIGAEVGLVQGGDVDGDGQAEIVVLGASWDLLLLESDGSQMWRKPALVVENAPESPAPGQLIVHDLDGDGRAEIVVMAPQPVAAVHVFDGDGNQVWRYPLSAVSSATRLLARDVNGDGRSEVVVTSMGQDRVYLLAADGRRLAEYYPSSSSGGTTGALDFFDLDDDGWGEIIVGTKTGIHVFGTSNQVVRKELWQSQRLSGKITALYLGDMNSDSRGEVIVGSYEGHVYILADDGRTLGDEDLGRMAVLALDAGDVDADGRQEVVVGTSGGIGASGGSPLYVVQPDVVGPTPFALWSWAISVKASFINSVAVCDLDNDGRAEILAGGGRGAVGTAVLLEGTGDLIWQGEFGRQVTAVECDGEQVLPALVVGTESGRVYRLTADGATLETYDLGAKVLGFGQELAVTADGKVYRLHEGGPSVVRELGGSPRKVQVDAGSTVMLAAEGEVSLVSGDGIVWQEQVDDGAISIAADDLDGDGEVEIAVGTNSGRVHLFGQVMNQPPLLTQPDLAETRGGYAYSVYMNDPDGDAVDVTLEIWDPSVGRWLPQPAQSAQGQARLYWEVLEPFDTWDSGRESRFRFSYDDGYMQGALKEIPGPLTIPTTPWTIYYGQWVGLGALILMIPALGLLFYRRQRTYRASPVGQAEALLKELRTNPNQAPLKLHDLARDDPIRLAYMPGLAREAREETLADLSEGFHLILTRPEVMDEGLRAVQEAVEHVPDLAHGNGLSSQLANLYQLCSQALEANTVSRIVALRSQLSDTRDTLTGLDSKVAGTGEAWFDLGGVAPALADLEQVVQALHKYQRVDLVEDKVAYLAQAIESLGRLDRNFQARLPQPERNILSRIATSWLAVSTNALEDLQGQAQIEVSLKTRQITHDVDATLALELTNTGRSPASNLTATLLPGQGYTVSNGAAHLDILPAGRSALIELPLSVDPSTEQFRTEFSISFDDRERRGKTHTFADLVHLLQPPAEFQPIPNPYAPGTPLPPGSPLFFGRKGLFQFIAENMAGLARQNILVLIGQRRMGKTSFLRQLPSRLGREYLPVYIDGQSLGVDPGMANFFYDLALVIADALDDQGIDVSEPELEDYQERPSGTFERSFLPTVFEAIGSRQLLLLFDEFEELEVRVALGKLEPSIFSYFRHLMQHGGDLGFIFVGTHRLEALSADYWSIFFNIALYKHVTFLSEAAAQALIVQPVAEYGLRYDDLAVDKILRLTAGHAYFLQLICHALVNRANREGRGYLTIQDVNDVLGEMVELGEAHFAFLWDQSSPVEQLVLASLTRLLGREPTVTVAQVAELLGERGIMIEGHDATEALRRLVERDILREVRGQPPRYEYKVALVRLWVDRNKALGQVIEEVA